MEISIKDKIKKPFPTFSISDYCRGISEMNACSNVLSLIVYDWEHENYEEKTEAREYIKKAIQHLFYEGAEPAFDNGHNWGYPVLAQALVLIKKKEELWNMFSSEEKERITWCMRMFALMWNFGCNRCNRYHSGIGLHGNYTYNNSPNYGLSNNILLMHCIDFFDENNGENSFENLSKWFTEINYDMVIEKLKSYNWMTAYSIWTTPGFKMPDGTIAPGAKVLFGSTERIKNHEKAVRMYTKKYEYGTTNYYDKGYGSGCCVPFAYDHKEGEVKIMRDGKLYAQFTRKTDKYPSFIFENILDMTFKGGNCKSIIHIEQEEDYSAHILDNTISPYEGQEGMMWEFNIPDDGMGRRSSIMHCEIDFILVCTFLTTMKLINRYDFEKDTERVNKIKVGMGDFIYKKEHGYTGYSLGNIEPENKRIDSSFWRKYWKEKVN